MMEDPQNMARALTFYSGLRTLSGSATTRQVAEIVYLLVHGTPMTYCNGRRLIPRTYPMAAVRRM